MKRGYVVKKGTKGTTDAGFLGVEGLMIHDVGVSKSFYMHMHPSSDVCQSFLLCS